MRKQTRLAQEVAPNTMREYIIIMNIKESSKKFSKNRKIQFSTTSWKRVTMDVKSHAELLLSNAACLLF